MFICLGWFVNTHQQ